LTRCTSRISGEQFTSPDFIHTQVSLLQVINYLPSLDFQSAVIENPVTFRHAFRGKLELSFLVCWCICITYASSVNTVCRSSQVEIDNIYTIKHRLLQSQILCWKFNYLSAWNVGVLLLWFVGVLLRKSCCLFCFQCAE
jgi:hypothetical protein